ncbi:SusC/RagA family TonB-linked outer membrane protein [Flavobacterium sp.]|uniref:SusC/RagA family TonB-linked outer membrane protein n=1 Tax=Flavobacterium sp. TaxID=239 RepID=UPI0039E342F6
MKHFICTFLTILSVSIAANAQEIKGNVTDQAGLPLPEVNILAASGKNTSTDFDGNFTIDAAVGEQLTFTMIGYETRVVNATVNMKVNLKEAINKLNEVIVVGYGTKKLGAITGSVSLIKSEEILKTPAQSAIQSIQGKAAGINIVTNDEPGGNPSVRIRGLGTVLGARDPLYIIDGVELSAINTINPINGLSPNDIESMSILKDASSLAIYGQKGANGVVIITTKKGRKGGVKVSYDAYYGQKSILKKVDMADSYRFAYYNNTALGSSSYYSYNQPYNTDWLEEITDTGEVTSNSVSLSGANDNANYYFGVSHYTEKGILKGTDYKRTNLLNKNEFNIAEGRLKVRNFFNLALAHKTPKPLSAFTNAYKQSPLVPVQYPNGRWGVPMINKANGLNDLSGTEYDKYNNVGNPVAQLEYDNQRSKYVTITASVAAELKLARDLTFTSNLGAMGEWVKEFSFTPLRDIWLSQNIFAGNPDDITEPPHITTAADYNRTFGNKTVLNNKLEQKRGELYNWNWDNYLSYKRDFGDHSVTATVGMSRTTVDNYEFMSAIRYNVPEQKNYWYLDFSSNNEPMLAQPDNLKNYHNTPLVSLAYFGRVEYDYKDKYLLTAIVRREGLSPFATGRKWDTFPSVSVGWVVTNENFMKDISFLNNLKLRGGYGEVGNGNGVSFNYLAFTLNKNYSYGEEPLIDTGAFVANAIDPNLTWETMKEIDLGIDFGFLQNKLTGTFDYYDRKSDDIILKLSLPRVLSEEETYLNSGQVTNKGIEATLRWQDNINDNLSYWVGGNFSSNKNNVSRIDSRYFKNFTEAGSLNNGQTVKRVFLDAPLGSFYVFEHIGYNADGSFKYNDMIDGKAGLTDNDRINAGTYVPKYTYGINVGVNYKNIDFSVDCYGVGGNKVYNGKKAQRFGGENVESEILDDFWTVNNTNAENPKPFNNTPLPSTYYIEDGDYLRINNITLGYTLPKMWEKLDKVRLYVTAVNPFIFTNYSGYSPEIVGGDGADPLRGAGIELDAYPTNRTFLVGANVNF